MFCTLMIGDVPALALSFQLRSRRKAAMHASADPRGDADVGK
jgi:hypothetical protein